MSNPAQAAAGGVRYGPDRRLALLAVPAAGLAALVAAVAGDLVGRFFSCVVLVVLLAIITADLGFAPRLAADHTGVRVKAPFDRADLRWTEIDSVRATTSRRYGLTSTILEISAGERLIVLDRHDLADDPSTVAGALAALRDSARSGHRD